jgi:hypothetical protein
MTAAVLGNPRTGRARLPCSGQAISRNSSMWEGPDDPRGWRPEACGGSALTWCMGMIPSEGCAQLGNVHEPRPAWPALGGRLPQSVSE